MLNRCGKIYPAFFIRFRNRFFCENYGLAVLSKTDLTLLLTLVLLQDYKTQEFSYRTNGHTKCGEVLTGFIGFLLRHINSSKTLLITENKIFYKLHYSFAYLILLQFIPLQLTRRQSNFICRVSL